MRYNKNKLAMIILAGMIIVSACTQSLSKAPVATPTLIPAGLFVSPLPSANSMDLIVEFVKQTAAAQTIVASGGTPAPATTLITPITPNTNTPTPTGTLATFTPTSTPAVACTAPVCSIGQVLTCPSGNCPGGCGNVCTNVQTNTPTSGTSYTLHEGEFPYCIARRYDRDPTQLLNMSGITSPDLYYAGLKLTIPQSGAFPGPRALIAHPAPYTVLSGDETLYTIACKFGDPDPEAIASKNGISVSAKLTAGQVLQIP